MSLDATDLQFQERLKRWRNNRKGTPNEQIEKFVASSPPSTCNTQQRPVQVCSTVAQHKHSTQQTKTDIEARCKKHREDELKRLVHLIADHHMFTQADRDEAMYFAMLDQASALTCFTSLARRAGLL